MPVSSKTQRSISCLLPVLEHQPMMLPFSYIAILLLLLLEYYEEEDDDDIS